MSIDFYNKNAEAYFRSTVKADMSVQYAKFLPSILKGGKILDVGCGSGRDSKFFRDMGFDVTAIDGSSEMCKLAEEFSGAKVYHMAFNDIAWENEFDGVWACASLLFAPRDNLPSILRKIANSMKVGATMYSSFKYGDGYLEADGKTYTMMNEKSVNEVFQGIVGFKLEDVYCSSDVRCDNDTKWINILCKKV